jgi:ABC-type lipoprotein export system ATPase subunit
LLMKIIETKNIKKRYALGEVDIPVLNGVSIDIQRGEMIALIGASGSGKTTLMNILGCMDHPTTGQYWLDGKKVSILSKDQRARLRNKKIGFIFQNFNLLPRCSATENVILPLLYSENHIDDQEAADRARDLLCKVGLEDRMHHEPSQLSGGQQQRVAIARALVNQPEILFADEPTGNLDSQTSREILNMFRRFNKEDGITIVLVTHDSNVIEFASRVIYMHDGMIVS